MDSNKIIKVEDRTKVRAVHFTHPGLMAPDAAEHIISEYEAMLKAENELYEARNKVHELESAYKAIKKLFDDKRNMFTLEFETYDKQTAGEECHLTLHNMGNDLIGRKTSV
jgi:predicted component of type VI protein secretion system